MNLKLSKDLTNEINKLLSELTEFNNFTLTNETPEITYKAFVFCNGLNLIRAKSFSKTKSYELDEKGIFAIQDGGIEKYLENIRTEKDLDNQIKRLTKKRLEWEYGVNFLFLIIGALITFFVTKFSESDNQKLTKEKLNNLKVEMYDSISKNRIRLNEQNIKLLDIKTLTDSLKINNLN